MPPGDAILWAKSGGSGSLSPQQASTIGCGLWLQHRERSMTIVPIQGLWETHLTVADLDRSIVFYRDVVGLTLAHTVPERHAAFFWIGQPRQAMLGLWSIHTSPMALKLHYAFQVSLDDVQASITALRSAGLVPTAGGGSRAIDEPEVIPWIPAASVYFKDPDGHSLEFIAMLPEPPQPRMQRVMLSEWRKLHLAVPSSGA
jgi:lactoylglutathione lyase